MTRTRERGALARTQVTLLAFAVVLSALGSGLVLAPRVSATTQVVPTLPPGRTVAVIVGINDYSGEKNDLRSAVSDARSVDAALANSGVPPQDRVLLLDRQATTATIREALTRLAVTARPDSTAVFFYAGHAKRLPSAEAIVTSTGGVMTDVELAQLLEPLAARHAWLGMATCFGGGFDELLAPGRVLTAAADARSKAYESDRAGASYFVDALVNQALDSDFSSKAIRHAFVEAKRRIQLDQPDQRPVILPPTSEAFSVVE